MSKSPKILVVDDEIDLCEIMQFNLQSEGYEVDTVLSAEAALELDLNQYDLFLFDVMMGGMSGFKLADIIRKRIKLSSPIIFLTAKTGEINLLTGFSAGGDDYIEKPYSIREIIVRIKAMLKRGNSKVDEVVSFNDLKVDISRKIVTLKDKVIELTRKEFDILSILIRNQRRYISRDEIIDKVWGDDVVVTERNVDVNIARLRKKIGKYATCIKGRTGYGYIFEDN
jgi:two-component system alkaline phosphatase synthesis response regulator PhoP